jgi:tRNA(Ile)-lysidine synthase
MPKKNAPSDEHLQAKTAVALRGISPAKPLLIGVSGGRDSVALLHAMRALGFKKLIVCHLDHQLRGRESSADARFVARLAGKWKLPAVLAKADVVELARKKRISVETAAREARYEFFAKVARARRCATLLLAHHADDQVETFLFNLFRGSGTAGLIGMATDCLREVNGTKLRVLRPMLAVWRTEIDDYVAAYALKFREDRTNRELANSRSKMRCEIIPAIERALGRDVRKAVWKTAEILRGQQEFLQSSLPPDDLTISIPKLRDLPAALQSLAIHRWLKKNGVCDIGFDLVQSVRALLAPDAERAKVNLPGGRHARRRAKMLFVE